MGLEPVVHQAHEASIQQKGWSRHLALEVMKILIKTVGCTVWQERNQDRHLGKSWIKRTDQRRET